MRSVPVVLCPHPPLLLRELTGATDLAADLRAACVAAVGDLVAAGPGEVVVVGGADEPGVVAADLPVDVRRFGTPHAAPVAGPALPLSLGVGRRLLDEAGWGGPTAMRAVPWDASAADLEVLADDLAGRRGEAGLLLLGDGSARRGEKAPGFLDARAFAFDDAVAAALETGDAATLDGLDADLARDLMVGGRSVRRLLGTLGRRLGVARATLAHREDPFGVSYFVARWDLG